jgi:hypothetical protein
MTAWTPNNAQVVAAQSPEEDSIEIIRDRVAGQDLCLSLRFAKLLQKLKLDDLD